MFVFKSSTRYIFIKYLPIIGFLIYIPTYMLIYPFLEISQASSEKVESVKSNIEKEEEKGEVFPLPLYSLSPLKWLHDSLFISCFGDDRPNEKKHKAIDIDGEMDDPVYAVRKGTVFADSNESYGNFVILQHTDGIKTYYAHLNTIKVKKGDFVARRKVIGAVGNTGETRSTKGDGTHLHFEIRLNQKAIDPLPYIKTNNKKKQWLI